MNNPYVNQGFFGMQNNGSQNWNTNSSYVSDQIGNGLQKITQNGLLTMRPDIIQNFERFNRVFWIGANGWLEKGFLKKPTIRLNPLILKKASEKNKKQIDISNEIEYFLYSLDSQNGINSNSTTYQTIINIIQKANLYGSWIAITCIDKDDDDLSQPLTATGTLDIDSLHHSNLGGYIYFKDIPVFSNIRFDVYQKLNLQGFARYFDPFGRKRSYTEETDDVLDDNNPINQKFSLIDNKEKNGKEKEITTKEYLDILFDRVSNAKASFAKEKNAKNKSKVKDIGFGDNPDCVRLMVDGVMQYIHISRINFIRSSKSFDQQSKWALGIGLSAAEVFFDSFVAYEAWHSDLQRLSSISTIIQYVQPPLGVDGDMDAGSAQAVIDSTAQMSEEALKQLTLEIEQMVDQKRAGIVVRAFAGGKFEGIKDAIEAIRVQAEHVEPKLRMKMIRDMEVSENLLDGVGSSGFSNGEDIIKQQNEKVVAKRNEYMSTFNQMLGMIFANLNNLDIDRKTLKNKVSYSDIVRAEYPQAFEKSTEEIISLVNTAKDALFNAFDRGLIEQNKASDSVSDLMSDLGFTLSKDDNSDRKTKKKSSLDNDDE